MPLTSAAGAASGVRARFFRSPENGDCVDLTIVGDMFQTNVMHRVTPEHVERFPVEWNAYQSDKPVVDYGGTPLTDVPGIEQSMLTAYSLVGIHNAEQLASLNDGLLSALGTGGRAVRDAARQLIALNEAKAKQDAADADRQRLVELEAKQDAADAAREDSDRQIAELKAMLAEAEAKAPKIKAKPASDAA